MDIFVRDLAPGQNYAVQVRAVNEDGASPWSQLFTFNSGTDTVKPKPVDNLSWNVAGTGFYGTWTAPNDNTDNTPLQDLKDYVVTITSPQVPAVSQTYFTQNTRFEFSYEQNLSVFGSPQATVQISVQARDNSYLASTAQTDVETNPAPPAPTLVTTTPGSDAYLVTWQPVEEPGSPGTPLHDLRNYEVHHSTSADFTPSAATRKWRGNATIATIPAPAGDEYFVKVLAVDVFGTATPSTVDAFSTVTPIDPGVGPDSQPPPTPADLEANVIADVGDPTNTLAYAEVSWNTSGVFTDEYEDMYNDDPGNTADLAGYTLEYGPVGGDKQYRTLYKPPGGTEVINRTTIWGLRRGVVYEFKVAAFDVSLNYSAAAGPVTDSTPADITPPAAPVVDFSSVGTNFIATWATNTESDFSHYEYWVIGNGITKGPYKTTETRYELTLEQNRKWFVNAQNPKPAASVQFKIKSYDYSGNTQLTTVDNTAVNARPGAVANGSWLVNGTSFIGAWDANTEADFSHYQYYYRASKDGTTYSSVIGPFKNNTARLTLDLDTNRSLFNNLVAGQLGAYPYVELQVEHVDLLEQTSVARYIQLRQNPKPAAPASLTTVEQYDSVYLEWPTVAETDIAYYKVFVSQNSNFSGETEVYKGIANTFTWQSTAFQTNFYFRVRAYDVFDQASDPRTNSGNTAKRPRSAYTVDTVGPSTPTSLNVGAFTVINNNIEANATWTAVSDTDLQGYEIRWSPYNAADPLTRRWMRAVVGEDVTEFKLRYLEPNTRYIVEVRAFDFSANYTGWATFTTAGSTPNEKVNTAMVVEAPGVIRSSNYNSGVAGWQLSDSGLDVSEGRISAAALEIQSAPNIALPQFAGFDFGSAWYTTSKIYWTGLWKDYSGTVKRYNQSSLKTTYLDPGNILYFGPSATSYNHPVDSLTPYIASIWVYNPGATAADANFKIRDNADGTYPLDLTVSIPPGEWKRIEGVLTTKINTTLLLPAISMPTASSVLHWTAFQLERKVSGQTKASPWAPPGVTSVDGGIIRTGEIRSNEASVVDPSQPAWVLNTQGNMQVNDALIRGEVIVGSGSAIYDPLVAVKSYGYVAGSQGWAIKGNGDVEFNDGVFRGDVQIGTGAAQLNATPTGLWIGDTTFAAAPFSVTPQGLLKTTNFNLISGNFIVDTTGISARDPQNNTTFSVNSATGEVSMTGSLTAKSIVAGNPGNKNVLPTLTTGTVGTTPSVFKGLTADLASFTTELRTATQKSLRWNGPAPGASLFGVIYAGDQPYLDQKLVIRAYEPKKLVSSEMILGVLRYDPVTQANIHIKWALRDGINKLVIAEHRWNGAGLSYFEHEAPWPGDSLTTNATTTDYIEFEVSGSVIYWSYTHRTNSYGTLNGSYATQVMTPGYAGIGIYGTGTTHNFDWDVWQYYPTTSSFNVNSNGELYFGESVANGDFTVGAGGKFYAKSLRPTQKKFGVYSAGGYQPPGGEVGYIDVRIPASGSLLVTFSGMGIHELSNRYTYLDIHVSNWVTGVVLKQAAWATASFHYGNTWGAMERSYIVGRPRNVGFDEVYRVSLRAWQNNTSTPYYATVQDCILRVEPLPGDTQGVLIV